MLKKLLIPILFIAATPSLFSQASLIKDINPGTGNGNPSQLIEYNGKIYFKASDGTSGAASGTELWQSDGTWQGTKIVEDYRAGTASFNPQNFIVFANKLFFQGNDGINGAEIFSFDGSAISLFADIKSGTGSSVPQNFTIIGNNLFFKAQEATSTNNKLYKTNGVNFPTVVDNTYNMGFSVTNLGSKLILSASLATASPASYQLYSSDGNLINLIKIINNSGSASPLNFYATSGKVYFSADDGINGRELWITDGTENGTFMVKNIAAGSDGSSPNNFTEFKNKIYFSADDSVNGTELWVTDGTEIGTMMLKDINTSGNSSPSNFYVFNNQLFFSANDNISGNELWVTDGTSMGTRRLLDINPGSESSSPADFLAFNNSLYFSANAGSAGRELYYVNPSTLATTEDRTREVAFYPIPSAGKISNTQIKSFSYQIFTIDGAIVKSGKTTDGQINFVLPDGTYILKCTTDQQKIVTKIIVKN